MTDKIVVFGSAFNPPTLGHKDAISFLRDSSTDNTQIVLVPSFRHAFAKSMIDYEHRIKMLEMFTEDLQLENVQALAIEDRIAIDNQPVYTFDLLHYLETEHFKDAKISFAVGPDNVANWSKFYRADEIEKRWQVIHLPERVNVRSTMIRQKIADDEAYEQLTTKSVAHYITQYKLYLK